MKKNKKGFIPVMLTPFQENGVIDFKALTVITEWYIDSGASGLFANCLSSEMFNLTEEERLAVMKHVVEVADGSVPVIASGTFGGPIVSQAEFIKKAYATGIQASVVITSLLAAQDAPEELFNENVFELIELTDGIPLGFYECPEPFKRILSAQQLKQFVDTGRVVYHKDTCLDINLVKEKLSVTEGSAFELYDAYMVHAIESLKSGSAGLSCIQGNFFPELIVWICENYDNVGLQTEVEKVQQFLQNNMDVMHDVYPDVAKYFLQKRGMNISMFSRKSTGHFPKLAKEGINNLFFDYQSIRDEIGIPQ